MASIQNRGPHQWQATVRRKGYPSQSETFETNRDAEAWANKVEHEMASGTFVDRKVADRTSLGDLLTKYGQEVSPSKRSCRTELVTIRRLLRHPLALRPLSSLRNTDFSSYREQRLKERAANNSVRLELALLSTMFATAISEWDLPIKNFIREIKKPKTTRGRDRRLVGDEEERLLEAARASQAPALELFVVLAIETGMRAGNLVELRWEQVDFEQHVIFVNRTKTGAGLAVPLSSAAEAALRAFKPAAAFGKISSFYDSNGLGAAFRQARKVAV
jgi:integrase